MIRRLLPARLLPARMLPARLLPVLPVALLVCFLAAAPASAHVRVSSADATRGGYGLLTFRVPTESDTASTTGLVITFPSDTPISSVSTEPITGWTATPTTKKLNQPIKTDDGEVDSYVAKIVWTADAPRYGIKPGEFQQFNISAGPLPDTDSLVFPTVQRYSDGTTVAWDELSNGSGAEPEHPAPAIDLQPAATASPSAEQGPAASAGASNAPASNSGAPGQGTDWLSPIALGLAAIAVIISAIALLRSRRAA